MTFRIFATATALAASIVAISGYAQTTVTTEPVGFTSVTVPSIAVRALSLPLNDFPDCTATVSAVTNKTISTANAAWTANAYGPFSSKPHVVRFLSGDLQGYQFRIDSNTSDTLTLATNGIDLTTAIKAGERYSIFPVATLQSLFGSTAPSLTRSIDSRQADNVLIRGSSGWVTYYNDGVQWLHEGGPTTAQGAPPDNGTALLPEAGFLFVRRADTSYDFSVVGAVPTTKLVSDLPANETLLANRFPVAIKLSDLGLPQLAGWKAAGNPSSADKVRIRGSVGWLTYYFDGTDWRRVGPNTIENPTIPLGGALLVLQRTGAGTTLHQPLPY